MARGAGIGGEGAGRRYVKTAHKVGFAFGAVPSALTATIIGFFFAPFLLETALLSPQQVAAILLIGRCWDAVTDPSAGFLVARTSSRFGRLRVWIAAAIFPAAISYGLLWLTLPEWSPAARFAYYTGVYCTYQMLFTAYYVPYTSLTMQISPISAERDAVTAVRMIAEILAVLIGVGGQGFMVADSDAADGYRLAGLVNGCLAVVSGLILLITVPQLGAAYEVTDDRCAHLSLLAGLRVSISFRPYFVLTMIFLCAWISVLLVQTNILLYIKYALDIEGHFQFILITLLFTASASMPVWAWLSGRRGRKPTFVAGVICFALPLLSLFIMPVRQPIPMYFVASIAGVGFGAAYYVPWSMLPDVLDEYEFGSGITLAASTYVLSLGGYRNPPSKAEKEAFGWPDDVDQPSSLDLTLRCLVSFAPALFLSTSLIFLYIYPISESQRKANKAALLAAAANRPVVALRDDVPLLSGRGV
ncbi:major facilitator superfamily transporter domain-containing protein 2 [Thecamonas trahens ATCC 50062]|uniref:Major facilitator superfamily transporter domain-containing protein 2 n=1 Tax=Thecamonas trahens ATCC 50062 TaxID=461836 RepID=A0A0L0DB45_THETB|nr:major facilitator superfamily transporter domain-containing protein 2 [Thecamonas trahens ATCC 50062]KNC49465.1 major facilitator superfamily transporter domain-containing protein 2 [Thecamonas trahens ATCC 50062]|eukprot:XP_013757884.1 major facilitator superfamily transporter domain-containing protein 2 [Thecamonas trahens ATCC 50062]